MVSHEWKAQSSGRMLQIHVLMLDNSVLSLQVSARAVGRQVYDNVIQRMQLIAAEYFDLEFVNEQGLWCWLDHSKPFLKQVGPMSDLSFQFSVRFYTPYPHLLEDDYTRYLFALQIKKDLFSGSLICSANTAALLASYVVQAELGDYQGEKHRDCSYLRFVKLLSQASDERLYKVMQFHRTHVGLTAMEADNRLLDTARKVEFYGLRLHPSKDCDGLSVALSVAHMGVIVFCNLHKINTFSWAKIRKLSFKRRRFLIKLLPDNKGFPLDPIVFHMNSRDESKRFWKKCVEHHAFFRCAESNTEEQLKRHKPLVWTKGSTFRYTGRTQQQLLNSLHQQRRPTNTTTSTTSQFVPQSDTHQHASSSPRQDRKTTTARHVASSASKCVLPSTKSGHLLSRSVTHSPTHTAVVVVNSLSGSNRIVPPHSSLGNIATVTSTCLSADSRSTRPQSAEPTTQTTMFKNLSSIAPVSRIICMDQDSTSDSCNDILFTPMNQRTPGNNKRSQSTPTQRTRVEFGPSSSSNSRRLVEDKSKSLTSIRSHHPQCLRQSRSMEKRIHFIGQQQQLQHPHCQQNPHETIALLKAQLRQIPKVPPSTLSAGSDTFIIVDETTKSKLVGHYGGHRWSSSSSSRTTSSQSTCSSNENTFSEPRRLSVRDLLLWTPNATTCCHPSTSSSLCLSTSSSLSPSTCSSASCLSSCSSSASSPSPSSSLSSISTDALKGSTNKERVKVIQETIIAEDTRCHSPSPTQLDKVEEQEFGENGDDGVLNDLILENSPLTPLPPPPVSEEEEKESVCDGDEAEEEEGDNRSTGGSSSSKESQSGSYENFTVRKAAPQLDEVGSVEVNNDEEPNETINQNKMKFDLQQEFDDFHFFDSQESSSSEGSEIIEPFPSPPRNLLEITEENSDEVDEEGEEEENITNEGEGICEEEHESNDSHSSSDSSTEKEHWIAHPHCLTTNTSPPDPAQLPWKQRLQLGDGDAAKGDDDDDDDDEPIAIESPPPDLLLTFYPQSRSGRGQPNSILMNDILFYPHPPNIATPRYHSHHHQSSSFSYLFSFTRAIVNFTIY